MTECYTQLSSWHCTQKGIWRICRDLNPEAIPLSLKLESLSYSLMNQFLKLLSVIKTLGSV